MKNPMLANWIKIQKLDSNTYVAKDELYNLEYPLTPYRAWFIKQLDGKRDPYTIDKSLSRAQVNSILLDFEEDELIRSRGILEKGFLYILKTVWIPHVTLRLRLVSFCLNFLLMITWLPLTIFAAFHVSDNFFDACGDYMILGSILGLVIGIVSHELGHMIACLGFGGKVFEAGLMFRIFVPGAYVLINTDNIKKRLQRIQVNAAGIEVNFLLFAIFSIMSVNNTNLNGLFFGIALQNVLLGCLNLLLINGFDGMAIMGELFGIENLSEKVKRIVFRKRYRKRIIRSGLQGKAAVAICYSLQISQIALPLLISLNFLGVTEWFQ